MFKNRLFVVVLPVGISIFAKLGSRNNQKKQKIQGHHETKFEDSSAVNTWDFQVHNIKKFSASLIVVKNGEEEVVKQIEYVWSHWDKQPPVDGKITLLTQNGAKFGVKDKTTFSMDVNIPHAGFLTGKSEASYGDIVLESIPAPNSSGRMATEDKLFLNANSAESVPQNSNSENIYMYLHVFNKQGIMSVNITNFEVAKKISKENGSTVIAVMVRYEPFE